MNAPFNRVVKALDLAVKTLSEAVAGMTTTVNSLRDAVARLEERERTLSSAFFGRWDEETNKQVSGWQQILGHTQDEVRELRVELARQRRYALWAVIPLAIVTLRAFGVPTDAVAAFVGHLFH